MNFHFLLRTLLTFLFFPLMLSELGCGKTASSSDQAVSAPQQDAGKADSNRVSDERIDYSLTLVAEARNVLPEIESPPMAQQMKKKIEGIEKILKVLKNVNAKGVAPLRAHLAESHTEDQQAAWVRLLCAAEMPVAAEILANEPAPAGTNPSFPLWSVGRYYLDRGKRAEAVRVLTKAAALRDFVGTINGDISNNSLLFLAFPKTEDVDSAVVVSKGLQYPLYRFQVLLFLAQKCMENGDSKKCKELLLASLEPLESATAKLPEETRGMVQAVPLLQFSIIYKKLDAAKSTQYADQVIEVVKKIRDLPLAKPTKADFALGGDKSSDPKKRLPSREERINLLKRLAQDFWFSGDRKHSRDVFKLLREVSEMGLSGSKVSWAIWDVGMLQTRIGDYAAGTSILTSIKDIQHDANRCMMESNFPETADDAREFLTVFSNVPVSDGFQGLETSRRRMVCVLIKAGKIDEARKLAAAGNGAKPYIVKQLATENLMTEAEKELASITDQYEHDVALLLMAHGLMDRGDLDNAVHYLDLVPNTQALGSETSAIYLRAALACLQAERYADAARLGLRVDESRRDEITGELYRHDRLEELQQLVKDAESPRRCYDLVLALSRHGKTELALEELKKPGDFPIESYLNPATVARTWSTYADPRTIADWVRKLKDPAERCAALLAVARENIVKSDSLSRDLSGQAWYPRLAEMY